MTTPHGACGSVFIPDSDQTSIFRRRGAKVAGF